MELSYFDDEAVFYQSISVPNRAVTEVLVDHIYQACDDKLCIFRDEQLVVSLSGDSQQQQTEGLTALTPASEKRLKIELKNTDLLAASTAQDDGSSSIWNIFFTRLCGGIDCTAYTLCVSHDPSHCFLLYKQSNTKRQGLTNALLYAFFIVFIYALMSVPFHFLDSINPEILNTISTNIWLNIFFFLIFVFFAFSFFGYYELTLPSSWANRLDLHLQNLEDS